MLLKTGGNRPKIWQLAQRPGGGPATVLDQSECGTIRYDMPGDAAWLGTYRRLALRRAHAYDVGQSRAWRSWASRGSARSGSCRSRSNKVTKQAAIIADLESGGGAEAAAPTTVRGNLFCQVKKPQEITAPFGQFWR